MTGYLSSLKAYIPFGNKNQAPLLEPESIGVVKPEVSTNVTEEEHNDENSEQELPANKKTDEVFDPSKQPSVLWRVSSGLASGVTGTVGMSVGSVKWVAGMGYDATAAVGNAIAVSTKGVVNKVTLPAVRKKDKKE